VKQQPFFFQLCFVFTNDEVVPEEKSIFLIFCKASKYLHVTSLAIGVKNIYSALFKTK